MKRCSKKKSLKYVVCKKEDFARDDNNKLSVDNQKLLIFQKQTFMELSSSLHIVRYSKGQLSDHSLLAKLQRISEVILILVITRTKLVSSYVI